MGKLTVGAGPLAEIIFGDKAKARSVYHLVKTTDIPIFHLGSNLCGREPQIIRWIEERESVARAPKGKAA